MLVEGAVADPHRTGARVPGEVVERALRQIATAVDPVHDLEAAVLRGLEIGDELHELVGLPVEIEPVERLQRERGVSHPRVAVVPVALAAGGLGQRGREGRHGCARGHERQALDREHRPLDRHLQAVVGDASPREPTPPVACGGSDQLLGFGEVLWRRELLGPRESAVRAVTRLERVPPPHRVALDTQREVRLEADRLSGPGGVGGAASAVHERPGCRLAPVVEDRLADQLDLHSTLEALDGAYEHVAGVVVRRRSGVRRDPVLVIPGPDREGVAHEHPAGGGLPGRDEDVGPRFVGPRSGMARPERSKPEKARFAVEQAAEHARRVEARDAEPFDRPVRRQQRAGVTVGEKGVVRDRRKRRQSGHARTSGVCGGGGAAHDATQGACQRP